MIKRININQIKRNPNNPRLIRDDKFKKLVQSMKDFPEMIGVRPIVVNEDYIVLGGNQRLKAMKEAGFTDIPVEIVSWSEEKQREFVIKDNMSSGEWDWASLLQSWDTSELEKWSMDVPTWAPPLPENEMTEEEVDLNQDFDVWGKGPTEMGLKLVFNNKEEAEKWAEQILPDKKITTTGAGTLLIDMR